MSSYPSRNLLFANKDEFSFQSSNDVMESKKDELLSVSAYDAMFVDYKQQKEIFVSLVKIISQLAAQNPNTAKSVVNSHSLSGELKEQINQLQQNLDIKSKEIDEIWQMLNATGHSRQESLHSLMDMLESEQITFKTDEMDFSDAECDSHKQYTISDDSHFQAEEDKEEGDIHSAQMNDCSPNDQLINVETLSELSFHEESANQNEEELTNGGLSHSFKELQKKRVKRRKAIHHPFKCNETNTIKHIDNIVETLSELSFHE